MVLIEFEKELRQLLNKHGVDSFAGIPDYILSEFVVDSIHNILQLTDSIKEYNGIKDYDDSMDGDHESALASAGFGTDEDYGAYSEHL